MAKQSTAARRRHLEHQIRVTWDLILFWRGKLTVAEKEADEKGIATLKEQIEKENKNLKSYEEELKNL